LLHDSSYPELAQFYGSWTVLKNDVFEEAKRLFDTYGVHEAVEYHDDIFFLVSSASGERKEFSIDCSAQRRRCARRTIWYFTFPLGIGYSVLPYSGALEAKVVANSIPAGWNFGYSDSDCQSASLLDCVYVWKSVFKKDLIDLSKMSDYKQIKNYFNMIDHITGQSLPKDFLIIQTDLGCQECSGSALLVSKLMLHTVFLKNISNAPITADALIESIETSAELRPYLEAQSTGSLQTHPIAPLTLPPGQTIVLPLRISFRSPGSVHVGSATKVFESVRASKSEYLDRLCNPKARIRRDSFLPPSAPSQRTYWYGPAIVLKGISISGQTLRFDRPLGNFLEIAAGQPVGSCPYVFSYDDHDQEWVRRGKIIDNASAPEKEMTQRVGQDGLVTRYKIREEEPEIAFVHKVRLELALADGRAITLRPRNRLRPESADHYDKIKYGAEREYAFDLPVGVNPADVLKSTLAVTGYYLRYSEAAAIDDESGK
jgi:hypothetical protein